MQVWSSGFYGETINYLDVAYSERNCLVFDQSLLCVDDYSVCVVCARYMQHSSTLQRNQID